VQQSAEARAVAHLGRELVYVAREEVDVLVGGGLVRGEWEAQRGEQLEDVALAREVAARELERHVLGRLDGRVNLQIAVGGIRWRGAGGGGSS